MLIGAKEPETLGKYPYHLCLTTRKEHPIMVKNLFDTRGGVEMIERCEECNDHIPSDSESGLCEDCERRYVQVSDEDGD
jgi:Zn finger protein HypA/HybF involved in hydrogenase expression